MMPFYDLSYPSQIFIVSSLFDFSRHLLYLQILSQLQNRFLLLRCCVLVETK